MKESGEMNSVKKTDGYRTIRIQESLYEEIERLTTEQGSLYRSVSEFVHEALRVRLEGMRQPKKRD